MRFVFMLSDTCLVNERLDHMVAASDVDHESPPRRQHARHWRELMGASPLCETGSLTENNVSEHNSTPDATDE